MKILKIYVYLNTVFWNSFKNMYYIFQWKNLQKKSICWKMLTWNKQKKLVKS